MKLSLFKIKAYKDENRLRGTHGFIQNFYIRLNHSDKIFAKYNYFFFFLNRMKIFWRTYKAKKKNPTKANKPKPFNIY